MKWYIGQPVVAITNHSQGCFKKGQEFTIRGLQSNVCKCNDVEIDVGVRADIQVNEWVRCEQCNALYYSTAIWWFAEDKFAPLDTDISELTEILTQKQVI